MNTTHSKTLIRALVLGLTLTPALAHAHPGHGSGGLDHGFVHPFAGWDHLLAMIAVGLWAVQLGGRALWIVPATFVSVMTLGGILGMNGVALPGLEQGVVASVLVLGVLVAASVRLPVVAGAAIVGCFALWHGVAHGMEMSSDASGASFVVGFALATAILHLIGIGGGLVARESRRANWIRVAGASIAVLTMVLILK